MKILMPIAGLILFVMVQGCTPLTITPEQSRMHDLFSKMEAGQYAEQIEFPRLTWADIPELLQYRDSTRTLTTFPTNPLSSERQPKCSEGMVAMWLIEGIRKNAKSEFASLNPMVLPHGPLASTDWESISEQHHAEVAAAYLKWWREAASVSEQKGRATDPLQGMPVSWY